MYVKRTLQQFKLFLYRKTNCYFSTTIGFVTFSFNRLTWLWSITAEVFALNNFFICVIFYLIFVFDGKNEKLEKFKVS